MIDSKFTTFCSLDVHFPLLNFVLFTNIEIWKSEDCRKRTKGPTSIELFESRFLITCSKKLLKNKLSGKHIGASSRLYIYCVSICVVSIYIRGSKSILQVEGHREAGEAGQGVGWGRHYHSSTSSVKWNC